MGWKEHNYIVLGIAGVLSVAAILLIVGMPSFDITGKVVYWPPGGDFPSDYAEPLDPITNERYFNVTATIGAQGPQLVIQAGGRDRYFYRTGYYLNSSGKWDSFRFSPPWTSDTWKYEQATITINDGIPREGAVIIYSCKKYLGDFICGPQSAGQTERYWTLHWYEIEECEDDSDCPGGRCNPTTNMCEPLPSADNLVLKDIQLEVPGVPKAGSPEEWSFVARICKNNAFTIPSGTPRAPTEATIGSDTRTRNINLTNAPLCSASSGFGRRFWASDFPNAMVGQTYTISVASTFPVEYNDDITDDTGSASITIPSPGSTCTPPAQQCDPADTGLIQYCNVDNTWGTPTNCPFGETCVDDICTSAGPPCDPCSTAGDRECTPDGKVRICDGTCWGEPQACQNVGWSCYDDQCKISTDGQNLGVSDVIVKKESGQFFVGVGFCKLQESLTEQYSFQYSITGDNTHDSTLTNVYLPYCYAGILIHEWIPASQLFNSIAEGSTHNVEVNTVFPGEYNGLAIDDTLSKQIELTQASGQNVKITDIKIISPFTDYYGETHNWGIGVFMCKETAGAMPTDSIQMHVDYGPVRRNYLNPFTGEGELFMSGGRTFGLLTGIPRCNSGGSQVIGRPGYEFTTHEPGPRTVVASVNLLDDYHILEDQYNSKKWDDAMVKVVNFPACNVCRSFYEGNTVCAESTDLHRTCTNRCWTPWTSCPGTQACSSDIVGCSPPEQNYKLLSIGAQEIYGDLMIVIRVQKEMQTISLRAKLLVTGDKQARSDVAGMDFDQNTGIATAYIPFGQVFDGPPQGQYNVHVLMKSIHSETTYADNELSGTITVNGGCAPCTSSSCYAQPSNTENYYLTRCTLGGCIDQPENCPRRYSCYASGSLGECELMSWAYE